MRLFVVLMCVWGSSAVADGIVVSDCKFRGSPPEIAECSVTNNLKVSVAAYSYSVVIYSTDRAVPWIDTLNGSGPPTQSNKVSGGIEPNETIRDYFGHWTIPKRVEKATDLILEVSVHEATAADGSVIAID
ncbi:hypothetical protein A8B82_21070 [Sulfitobacter sp. EhC04]|nr:hypothetical protein A8B82_21070 [Sulfitobacter sp. EhC04]